VIALVLVVAALQIASSVFAPVALAFFIVALIRPLQRRLETRLPTLVALFASMLVTIGVFSLFTYLAVWGFGRVARSLVQETARFQTLYDQATSWLEGHGVAVGSLWSEHLSFGWVFRAAQGLSSRLNTMLSFLVVAVVYVLLALMEVGSTSRKVRLLNHNVARVITEGAAITATKLRKYMLVRTQMSLLTGGLVSLIAALAGVPMYVEWGVIAFTLNYIPFIGPLIATVFPTFFVLVQSGDWKMAIALFTCFNLVQFLVGSTIEPRISGTALSMSPFVVLFSVFFWAFLWGVFGAFIGVPITIAILTFCAQDPRSRWVSDLFGSGKLANKLDTAESDAST
jgi:AI-2 transport protein TqsA